MVAQPARESTHSDAAKASERGVTDLAIGRIQEMLLSGELGPGDQLPTERELALAFGISRNSIREAVRVISAMGILKARVGDGTYVTDLHPGALLDGSTFVLELMRRRNVSEVLEIRRTLDSLAASRAAGRITDDQLSQLGELMQAMDSGPKLEDRIAADLAFHRVIAHAGGNEVLAALLDVVAGNTAAARHWRGASDSSIAEGLYREHQMIYEALARRDADLAGVAAAAHVAGVEAWMTAKIGAETADKDEPTQPSAGN